MCSLKTKNARPSPAPFNEGGLASPTKYFSAGLVPGITLISAPVSSVSNPLTPERST